MDSKTQDTWPLLFITPPILIFITQGTEILNGVFSAFVHKYLYVIWSRLSCTASTKLCLAATCTVHVGNMDKDSDH